MARYTWESPGNTEIAGYALRVVIERNAIVAVLDSQDVDPTVGSDQVGEKMNLADIAFLIIRDNGTPPPPLCLVVAPHPQDGLGYLHTRMGRGRGEHELTPIQMSCPTQCFLVAIPIQQTNGAASVGQGLPIESGPVIPPYL